MSEHRDDILEESLAWIKDHPLATTKEVPISFVKKWAYDPNSELGPSSFYLTIFTFGYCQRQILKLPPERTVTFSVELTKMLPLFSLWQLKLGLVELKALNLLETEALALFDFPEGEILRCSPCN